MFVLYGSAATGADSETSVDYAFLSLIILSPDFAAANYTLHDDEPGVPVDTDISIYRLPLRFDIAQGSGSRLQLEVAMAYQRIDQVIPVDIVSGESDRVDTNWDTYAIGLGLLYEHGLTSQLWFTPSLRLGITDTRNRAAFVGPNRNYLATELKDELNWEARAGVLNIGLGLAYSWQLLDRVSSARLNVYQAYTESFNESLAAAAFAERASLLTLENDMIFPSGIRMAGSRLDFVLLLGVNHFFDRNHDTLGFSTSYQAGAGIEFALSRKQKPYGHVRFSGEVIRAKNLDGWMLSIGYTPRDR